jgi:sec-independent protein translocase protein TatB
MPQIGWFEILVVVVLAILIIGPKDFPIVIRKIGNWIGSAKRYFSEIQEDVTNLQETIEDEILIEEKYSKSKTKDKQKDE